MPHEYNEVKKDPVFGPILAIHENSLAFSAILVHSFMCRQLVTAKKHELWFVFARRPPRFSLQEYHAVTGLKCEDDGNYNLKRWVNDDGFWSRLLMRGDKVSIQSIRNQHIPNAHRWTRKDRLRLVYLSVISGLLMVKDEKVGIPHEYIKLIMDFSKLRAYPWGLHSFDHLVNGIVKARTLLSNPKNLSVGASLLRSYELIHYHYQSWSQILHILMQITIILSATWFLIQGAVSSIILILNRICKCDTQMSRLLLPYICNIIVNLAIIGDYNSGRSYLVDQNTREIAKLGIDTAFDSVVLQNHRL